MNTRQIIQELKRHGSEKNLQGMERFGIMTGHALGVPVPQLRKMARQIGKNHGLALSLWATRVHEARILATMIDDPRRVTTKQMDTWLKDIDSWDLCDQACGNLFDKTTNAYEKAAEWTTRTQEYEKRAGFSLMAALAVHDKTAGDDKFLAFLPMIKREADDERNFVRKAVNWALRQIGKRNKLLNIEAIRMAEELLDDKSPAARWIASDALRELRGEAVQKRLKSWNRPTI